MKSLWEFTDTDKQCTGSFRSDNPGIHGLYFPLCNNAGLKSAVTPDLKGDIKTDQNHFLTLPCVTEDLHSTKAGRNFWVRTADGAVWSATGESASAVLAAVKKKKKESVTVSGEPGSFTVIRKNKKLGLTAKITLFVPAIEYCVECMLIHITNTSDKPVKLTPFFALPLYGRSADNQRDHRQVTTLLNRIIETPVGPVLCPTMSFDERGHAINTTCYYSFGIEEDGLKPAGWWGTLHDFIGKGTLEAPEAVYTNAKPPKEGLRYTDGTEALSALRFNTITLKPGKIIRYTILNGIASDLKEPGKVLARISSADKAQSLHKETLSFWQTEIGRTRFSGPSADINNQSVWITFQPMLRKIFGCSFLPDFGYGRGGRGWRDLWQDCLALVLNDPDQTRGLLKNNFEGIRIDGSNATIIGTKPGEFIADRNNITRVWMDHGIWPYLTTRLYIDQSSDSDFLLDKVPYFKDLQASRSSRKDTKWNESYGNRVKTSQGSIYKGTILEHILLQTVTQFFNVGAHNTIRLEDADWNDGLDMARDKGESVAFTAMYGHNLLGIADCVDILRKKGVKTISLLKEARTLFDTLFSDETPCYDSVAYKKKVLRNYMKSVVHTVSGETVKIKSEDLASDLRRKGDAVLEHVRKKEFIKKGFFNGYYDNNGKRVEGAFNKTVRMTLTGQVFPIMSGAATDEQISSAITAVNTYLKDKNLGGIHLNTDFGGIRMDLGRAFGFAYGDKENGAFFSHMIVMYMYALYSRGFAAEAHKVFESVMAMCLDKKKNKIFPNLPEYFNSRGEGRYCFLTGSASWMFLTMLTQMYGIRGVLGDLLIDPKLTASQFDKDGIAEVQTLFRGKTVRVVYRNTSGNSYPDYRIGKLTINGADYTHTNDTGQTVIPYKKLTGDSIAITVNLL